MLFCPTCANVLMVEEGPECGLRYACNTCPYVYNIKKKISSRTFPKLKVRYLLYIAALTVAASTRLMPQ